MWKEAVPEVQGKVRVGAAQTGDEVVFEHADGVLGSIVLMNVGWGELKVNVAGVHELLQGDRSFIVQFCKRGWRPWEVRKVMAHS